jgi:hypothetical protein
LSRLGVSGSGHPASYFWLVLLCPICRMFLFLL